MLSKSDSDPDSEARILLSILAIHSDISRVLFDTAKNAKASKPCALTSSPGAACGQHNCAKRCAPGEEARTHAQKLRVPLRPSSLSGSIRLFNYGAMYKSREITGIEMEEYHEFCGTRQGNVPKKVCPGGRGRRRRRIGVRSRSRLIHERKRKAMDPR